MSMTFSHEPPLLGASSLMSFLSYEPPLLWGGVATIGRLFKNIGLSCRIQSVLWGSFAKETYNFKEPSDRISLLSLGSFSVTRLRESEREGKERRLARCARPACEE